MTQYPIHHSLKKLLAKTTLFAAALLCAATPATSRAALIAVVDSGTDELQPELASKIWNNPADPDDGVDNDNNGYIDDTHGWNFVDNNRRLIDRKSLGTFSPEVGQFFAIQTKYLLGTATAEEIQWMRTHVQDPKFVAELERFGNFVHGTHVAGIAAKDAPQAQLMILKIIGQPTESYFERYMRTYGNLATTSAGKEKMVLAFLGLLGKAQGAGMAAPGKYIATHPTRVANCSFGSSRNGVKPLLKGLIEKILGPITDEQLNGYADYFMKEAIQSLGGALIAPSPKTLFVIAAGNDGSDNDVAPAAPANVKLPNTISVAATLGTTSLATFSNYGVNMVDIAAPGVGIRSTMPGSGYLELSGTSQATPYVTNLAGRIIDANPRLSPAQVKAILMETVDKKPFLVGKVKSGGIANPERAVFAARLSLSTPLYQALTQANQQVRDVAPAAIDATHRRGGLFITPMPGLLR